MKHPTSDTSAEVDDRVSISGKARDEHRLGGIDVDAGPDQSVSEQA